MCIERFHTVPRDTKDNSLNGHVGVPNKRDNQNSFVESTLKHGRHDVRLKRLIRKILVTRGIFHGIPYYILVTSIFFVFALA